MKKIILSFTMLFVLCLFGCTRHSGSGNIISENKSVAPFSAVDISGPFEVEVRQGMKQDVVLETDDNLEEYVSIKVQNNTLRARIEHNNFRNATFRLLINSPVINSVKAAVSADVEILDVLKDKRLLELKASSGSEIKGAVDAPEVALTSSSGASLKVSGRTRTLKASASSGSEINAERLFAETSEIAASSGAEVHVHSSISITARASSGGNVGYRGGAAVNQNTSSGGQVERED